MSHTLQRAGLRSPRIVAALLVTLALGVTAFLVVTPGAKAATGSCDPGDFCLWYLTGYSGGLYEYSGSDSRLDNDHFENINTNAIVNNNTESAFNYGNPASYDDVRAYDGLGYTGASFCIPRGGRISNLGGWNNRISSYKWVTSC
jgi:hypothetical protein